MKRIATLCAPLLLSMAAAAQTSTYRNPVIDRSAPDPTVLRADDGTFYLYSTEDVRNLPIYSSRNLVDWKFVGTAFNEQSRPQWLPDGGIWAPCINRIGSKYVLYYSKSVWGGEWDAGIGVATSSSPTGPFTDCGNMFVSRGIGIQNCIDPFYIEDGGRKYLFWGSFRGIYGAELTDDGLKLKPGVKPQQVAGTFMEATYIKRRGGYYYLFGSAGTCCDGERSTYRVTVGRSRSLFGPYTDRQGRPLLDNHYEVVLHRNQRVIGPGHNAEFVSDAEGNDWMLYHGFSADTPDEGRKVWLDRIDWVDGWPHIMGNVPSAVAAAPVVDGMRNLTLSGLNPSHFEMNIEGKQTHLYTLRNSKGMEVCFTNFGARIVSIMVPDRNGKMQDVVLSYDNIAQYADREHFGSDFGAAIGRYANRINQGRITIDGKTIQLPQNNYGHCLHGGFTGWQYKVYDGRQLNDSTLQMSIFSPDGDNGFPGNVNATVTYTLTSDNSIDIRYEATSSKKTFINMTNHSYFNLNGDPSHDGENQMLYINANRYTPADTTYMTTGEELSVAGTPMDFRRLTPLSRDINNKLFDMTRNAGGFDHNWCLNTWRKGKGNDKLIAAALYSPATGIRMDVYTDEPGIQVYTGNFLDASFTAKHGYRYPRHSAVCLETQHYPDSPNKPQWPSTLLEPGKKYTSHCRYHFSIGKEEQIAYADPTIVRAGSKYYLTGTANNTPQGFDVLESKDLKNWTSAGHLLTEGKQVYGDKGFWAPQLYNNGKTWQLAYTANEQVAVAEASSLIGPYTQKSVKPVDASAKNIDPFVFTDDDGKSYLYHVRFDNGNYIWVAAYDKNTGSIDHNTLKRCLDNTEAWENTGDYPSAPIMEGPTVIKRNGKYYMFYSANHFMSRDYAVGYAVADSPMGPWKKPANNRIIHRSTVGENGSGHGDVFYDKKGNAFYVYHVHNSNNAVSPRLTRIVPLHFAPTNDGYDRITVKKDEVIVPMEK